MNDNIKISVVIPSYNRERTIEKCLESVLNQTYPPYEVLVIDDGSTDNTIRIVEALNSEKVKVLRQDHKGAQAARNYGIRAAKGDYIAFLDSDDEWLPNKLEIQAPYLDGRKDVVVYCDYYEANRRKGFIEAKITEGGDGDVYKEMLMNGGPTFQGMICSKKALMEMGLLDENVPAYQEWETVIRLSQNNKFIHIKKALFKWNWHNGETISKDAARGIRGYEYIVEKYKWEILKYHGLQGLQEQYKSLIKQSFQNENVGIIKYILKWMLVDALIDMKSIVKEKKC